MKNLKNKKIGLCLSGGGLRAIAHIGVIKALEEYAIKPDFISGTSAGAIIGAFYSAGYAPQEMLNIVAESSFFSRQTIKINGSGIFNAAVFSNLFQKYIKEDDFKALNIPLFVAATDIDEGKIKIFSEGKLYAALLATASIPFVFPATEIDQHLYCDGGLLDNLPIEPLISKGAFVIASHVNSIHQIAPDAIRKMSVKSYTERLFHLGLSNHVYQKRNSCDLFIDPPNMTQFSMFEKKNAPQLFAIGYEYGLKAIKSL